MHGSGQCDRFYLHDVFDARELDIFIGRIPAKLLSKLPNSIFIPDGPHKELEILARELGKLTDHIFDGTTLSRWADACDFRRPSPIDPLPVSDIVASLNYATDVVTISQAVLGPPEHIWHARQIDPKYIKDFQNNSGFEMIEALSNGVAIEDIVCY